MIHIKSNLISCHLKKLKNQVKAHPINQKDHHTKCLKSMRCSKT